MYKFIFLIIPFALLGCGESSDNISNTNINTDNVVNELIFESNGANSKVSLQKNARSKKIIEVVTLNYINDENIYKIKKIMDDNGHSKFMTKTVSSLFSDYNKDGKEYYVITFTEGGYIVLDPSFKMNAIYSFDENNKYDALPTCLKCKSINSKWLSIIAEEIDISSVYKYANRNGSLRELVTKITWSSGSRATDFDLFIKNPDGEICNWFYRDRQAWGATHLRDDRGEAYRTSFEAFSVDLDIMDQYASNNNLFDKDSGRYKFYIARYSGPNINYNFSYGLGGSCSASSSNNCSKGNWSYKVASTGRSNARYAVQYTPKQVSTVPQLPPNREINTSVEQSNWKRYEIRGGNNTRITVSIENLSNDVDLYVRKNHQPTVSTGVINNSNLCVPFKGQSKNEKCVMTVASNDILHVGVYGAQAANFRIKAVVAGDTNNTETMSYPFPDDEEWTVCQGYNTNPITHHDTGWGVDSRGNRVGFRVGSNLTYSLDLTTNSQAASGTYGCNGANNFASDEEIQAPATGYISRLVSSDMVCIRYDNATLGSMMLGHFATGGRNVVQDEAVRKGQILGKIGTNTVSGGPFAHIHMGLYSDQDCQTPIPFGNVFNDGTNYSSDDSNYQWYGEVLGD